jgi:creatinine amidohydrolase/Fe(II)-dependent formamide hydrolase-like protein
VGGAGRRRAQDPYAVLEVIERLAVGPARVEPRRIVVPYAVTRRGRTESFLFIDRWEQDVLDPADPADRNLAALIGLQVALNYGLFCRQIVLHGPLDAADRAFVEAMAENTAREILVNKLLQPNPFLRAPAVGLPALPRGRYLRARLSFPDAVDAVPRASTRREARDGGGRRGGARHAGAPAAAGADAGHAVLSSGGKDSLLAFGMLEELGRLPHAVFVNESGRHWYTALNAYRHLSTTRPERTARVWTNSDRLFAWMLRRLPFVRPDFQDLRSDGYPIRLWTVAVFGFSALPVLRARGLSRLLIGDEYDTSVRARHRGIPHYAGLYDQSRWFDRALTAFYARKGWGFAQFSALRPASELLIERALAERYPELLAQQVSCHAAHMEGTRVHPCGACEKCRRIVGMLVALGADPGACGYTQEQVRACLAAFARKGVHQERVCAEQVLHTLVARGLVTPAAGDALRPAEHIEARSLRFDPQRSPAEDLPADLRGPLHGILSRHADGALLRVGRSWRPFELAPESSMSKSKPRTKPRTKPGRGSAGKPGKTGKRGVQAGGKAGAERGAKPGGKADARAAVRAAAAPTPTPTGPRSWMLGELTWPDAEKRFKEVDVALLPVGSIEQHGPHLPLDVDAFDAEYLCHRVAEDCTDPRPFVLPLIPYGVAYHHDDFAGTISIGPDTLSRLVYEVGMSISRNGIRKLVIVNGHGGNRPSLRFAAQMINRDARIFTCVETGETSDHDIAKLASTENDVHAGEIETATTLAIRPHLVQMERARRFVPKFSSEYLDFTSSRSVEWFAHTRQISRSGVMGDPTKASAEQGKAMWAVMTKNLVEFVEHIKRMSLKEIYQKRY